MPPAHALAVTTDPLLREEVSRLAASVGVDLDVVTDPVTARGRWHSASLVLVGDDVASAISAHQPAARQGVVLVTRDGVDGAVWERAIGVRADSVVTLPSDVDVLMDRIAAVDEPEGPRALVVGVVGARGGAGASSLTVALGLAGARAGLSTFLVDVDPLGGGLDLVLGCEDADGVRWSDLADARGNVSARALSALAVRSHGIGVLPWSRGPARTVPSDAVTAVLAAAARGHELVVVDLARRRCPVTEAGALASDVLLVLAPAEVRATAAAECVRREYADLVDDIRVVLRTSRRSSTVDVDVAAVLGCPMAGSMRPDRSAADDLASGVPPGLRRRGPLASLATRLVADLLAPRRTSAR